MAKVYIFGIGGTGSRVLRSLTMLMAAGVQCSVDTIVPIIIDRDLSNRDFSRTKLLIEDYIEVNKQVSKTHKEKFLGTKISLLENNVCLQLEDKNQKFGDFIGKNVMSPNNKALIEMLFTKETLNLDMTVGFQGNPNIGSVVLNQFDKSDIFKAFANDFKDGDKIFIISSIFGGTGASGFPLLRKILQTPNMQDREGKLLPNWGLINKAPIGAISVLPYFTVGQPKDDSQVDSDTFIDKARAALSYYKAEDRKIDTLYYIADKRTTTYDHNKGGESQKNNAHFVELASALAILDFINPQKERTNIKRTDDQVVRTAYKEFGILKNLEELAFSNLADETKNLIVNPLSRFLLFTKYMGYVVVETNIEGQKQYAVKKRDKCDIFKQESKYQPYSKKNFTNNFRSTSSIQKLESLQSKFVEWLMEMELQERKFKPYNLMTCNCSDYIKKGENITCPKDNKWGGWTALDRQLNKKINTIDGSLNKTDKFIELFFQATKEVIQYKK